MTVIYQPILVFLSIGVAILGSLSALALTSAANRRDSDTGQRSFALANGALIMGATIWSMHFIAMMAAEFPVPVNYNPLETVASICIAIVATGAGLHLASLRERKALGIPLGGLLMGLGIASMHYLGMSAIRGCGLAYDLRLVGASLAIAIGASTAALWFAFFKRGLLMTLAGGVVQGLAIASMHYTAMAATYFVPLGVSVELSTPLFSQEFLAYMIACGIGTISVGNLAMAAMISRDIMTREQIRLVQATFRRLEPSAPQVSELFYNRLFETAPHLRGLFPTDLTDQKFKIMAMLGLAVGHLHRIDDIVPASEDLGRRHVSYGATEDDYKPVGGALIWALEQALRDEFTPEVRAAWLAAYRFLTDVMIEAARDREPTRRGLLRRPSLTPSARLRSRSAA